MILKKVTRGELHEWVDEVIAARRTYGVQSKSDQFAFAPLKRASDLRLDYDVTILPPKTFFQPQWEDLITYRGDEGYQSVIEAEPFVLLGVHPYDLVAVSQMDEIFSQSKPDIRYLSRRESATLVAVDVQSPSRHTFAGYMGTSSVDRGYDILLTRMGDEYLVDIATERGREIMGRLERLRDAAESWLDQRMMVWEHNQGALRAHQLRADPSTWPDLLEKSYEHPVWEEKARLCFSCGSCTLVCPTCYCFDIREDVGWDLETRRRYRVWDGCMLQDFARVAGGLNFRKDAAARYRHRYYRKGKYVPEKLDGQIACVGCGRCIQACVANIADPVEVFNRLAEGA